MNRDAAKSRGLALRSYLAAHLPVPGASSVTALARKAGIQPTTASSWWARGYVPDHASLELLAEALGVGASDLIAAYEGSAGRAWVLSESDLEALLERAAERGAERALQHARIREDPSEDAKS
jgi:transcriptional regulator with XRE-family HTH domain